MIWQKSSKKVCPNMTLPFRKRSSNMALREPVMYPIPRPLSRKVVPYWVMTPNTPFVVAWKKPALGTGRAPLLRGARNVLRLRKALIAPKQSPYYEASWRGTYRSYNWNRNPIERLLRRRLTLSDQIDRLEPPRNEDSTVRQQFDNNKTKQKNENPCHRRRRVYWLSP